MGLATKPKNICKYYSFSLGHCFPIKTNLLIREVVDISDCPVIKAGKQCKNFIYLGNIYGVFNHGTNFNR